jgi:hypothetical protein
MSYNLEYQEDDPETMNASTATISQTARVYATSLLTILQGLLPPPLVPAVLDWNFNGTLVDSIQGIEFQNDFGIVVTSEHAVIDQLGGSYFLKAMVPSELVSPFSKTLLFRFKSLEGFSQVTHFVFSTYEGDTRFRHGMMIRILNSNIQIAFQGRNNFKNEFRNLHNASHVIQQGLPVIFDNFVHLAVVLDFSTHFISTYINGVLNASTYSLASNVPEFITNQGTYFGGVANVPFYINKYTVFGDGTALHDDFKFFNQALTQEEITAYYDQSI